MQMQPPLQMQPPQRMQQQNQQSQMQLQAAQMRASAPPQPQQYVQPYTAEYMAEPHGVESRGMMQPRLLSRYSSQPMDANTTVSNPCSTSSFQMQHTHTGIDADASYSSAILTFLVLQPIIPISAISTEEKHNLIAEGWADGEML